MSDSTPPPFDSTAIVAGNPPPPTAALPPASPAAPQGPRGMAWLAWIVILAMGAGLIYWQNEGKKQLTGIGKTQAVQLIMLEFQARLYIAIPTLTGQPLDPANVKVMEELNRGSIQQRLSVLITLGEIAGPQTAKDGLLALKDLIEQSEFEASETDKRNLDILIRLYTDYSDGRPFAPTVSPDERDDIKKSLGWFGELALAPAIPNAPVNPERERILADASQTLTGALIIVIVAICFFALGIVGLLLVFILALKGLWKSRLGPAVPHHGVYAETFAIWFMLYFALAWSVPPLLHGRLHDAVATSIPMILSLIALVWPVVRGVPWKQVRKDIGLTLGEQPLIEPTIGFVSYAMSLPFLIVGFGFMIVLLRVFPKQGPGGGGGPFDPDPSMAHPLIEMLRNAKPEDVLYYFFLMSVCAPVMEEIMFRGCLYRHLRDATRAWKLGVLFSALVASTIFAAAHPQGVYAIPILASLACGFTLAREWRGTLIPSIIAHGLNNSLILAFAILCLMKW